MMLSAPIKAIIPAAGTRKEAEGMPLEVANSMVRFEKCHKGDIKKMMENKILPINGM